ncbi:alpha/beta fold hydrolase [Streptomyces sp. PG2]
MWAPQLAAFSADRRVVAPDLRGYGASPVPDDTSTPLSVFADDLAALLDHLGIDRCVLGGVSMGGQIVMECCARFPGRIAGIVLADTFPAAETESGPPGPRRHGRPSAARGHGRVRRGGAVQDGRALRGPRGRRARAPHDDRDRPEGRRGPPCAGGRCAPTTVRCSPGSPCPPSWWSARTTSTPRSPRHGRCTRPCPPRPWRSSRAPPTCPTWNARNRSTRPWRSGCLRTGL